MNTNSIGGGDMTGVSLIELMIAVGIIGIIGAIAAPLMTDYIGTSRSATMTQNIQTIRAFQDTYKLEHRAFVEGEYDPADPDATDGLKDLLGWEPRSSDTTISYVATCTVPTSSVSDPKCKRTSGYYVTATDSDDGETVCVAFEGATCP